MSNNYFDSLVLAFLKFYYWPYFIVGNIDNFKEIILGKNICK